MKDGEFKLSPQKTHPFFKKYEKESPDNSYVAKYLKETKAEDSIRLNKYISNSGVCSRRDADNLISKGDIKVNGKVVTELGTKINPKDIVEFKGRKIFEAQHVYILLNKPKDTITTTKDPENRATVMDLVEKATNQRIFPVGRLDRNTTGVILLTNDGDFAQKLSHPSSNVKKIYYAELDNPLKIEDFNTLKSGIDLPDGFICADDLAFVDNDDNSKIGIEIHSGRNRIVHRMFEHLGYKVRKLDRVVYAGLDKSGLKKGKWRFLRYNEVQQVLNSI
ncbi:MAG: rRNA pseudouridine synthase [Bacteroidetes bacterium]|nr:rRNA pseudouridine synthase [Bacteroidota bacterium]